MLVKFAPCRYTKIHCARKPGLKSICHAQTWLNSTNDPRVSCYLRQSVLGPKACPKQWREFVEIAETSGKCGNFWKKFAGIFCSYFFKRARKTMRVHIDHLVHLSVQLKLAAQARLSKTLFLAFCGISTGCSPRHWKPKITCFTPDDVFGLEITSFLKKINPCLKFRIVGFSR